MAIYNISYDLSAPDRNYEPLYAEIKKLGSCARPLKSTWLVDSQLTEIQIRDRLISVIDRNDHLLVTILARGAAWFNIPGDVAEWIRQRM